MTYICRICGLNRHATSYVWNYKRVCRVCAECRAQGWPAQSNVSCTECRKNQRVESFAVDAGRFVPRCRRCRDLDGSDANPEVLRNVAEVYLARGATPPPECAPVLGADGRLLRDGEVA